MFIPRRSLYVHNIRTFFITSSFTVTYFSRVFAPLTHTFPAAASVFWRGEGWKVRRRRRERVVKAEARQGRGRNGAGESDTLDAEERRGRRSKLEKRRVRKTMKIGIKRG